MQGRREAQEKTNWTFTTARPNTSGRATGHWKPEECGEGHLLSCALQKTPREATGDDTSSLHPASCRTPLG